MSEELQALVLLVLHLWYKVPATTVLILTRQSTAVYYYHTITPYKITPATLQHHLRLHYITPSQRRDDDLKKPSCRRVNPACGASLSWYSPLVLTQQQQEKRVRSGGRAESDNCSKFNRKTCRTKHGCVAACVLLIVLLLAGHGHTRLCRARGHSAAPRHHRHVGR